jgi:predicted RNA-binding Zn ribbon-like protein
MTVMEDPPPRGIALRAFTGAGFRFDPGSLCLELLATSGSSVLGYQDTLLTPADLAAWAAQSRLAPTPGLEITELDVVLARQFRDALHRMATTWIDEKRPRPEDLDLINQAANHQPLTPAIGQNGERRWQGSTNGPQLLATIAHDAISLLTGSRARHIRRCAAEHCGLIYVDISRPGNRRWCSMERCGNLHKVRMSRARKSSPMST